MRGVPSARVALLALAVLAAGCNPYDPNLGAKPFLCGLTDPRCPEGYTPVDLNPLPPQRQASKFLHEYLPSRLKFKGSLVLVASGGKKFGVVGLVLNQGLLTVVPVIPEKASVVPN